MDSRLFSEANVFCFLFSRNRRILLLDASASRIKMPKLYLRIGLSIGLFMGFCISLIQFHMVEALRSRAMQLRLKDLCPTIVNGD